MNKELDETLKAAKNVKEMHDNSSFSLAVSILSIFDNSMTIY